MKWTCPSCGLVDPELDDGRMKCPWCHPYAVVQAGGHPEWWEPAPADPFVSVEAGPFPKEKP